MQQMIFIADPIACPTCFGHLYAHHQELESIKEVVAVCDIWCSVFKLSVWFGAEGCVSGLRAAFVLHASLILFLKSPDKTLNSFKRQISKSLQRSLRTADQITAKKN
jgi:hypothetical protein